MARARLRAATADLHARVDALFPGGLGCLDDYRRYLLGMHRFAVDYEHATGTRARHSTWLSADLATLSLAPLCAPGDGPPAPAQAARLGWRYVMAGSSLGARVLLRDARRLGFGPGHGADFLAGHAAADDWSRLQPRLRALGADEAGMGAAVSGARAAFARVRTCFEHGFQRIPVAAAT